MNLPMKYHQQQQQRGPYIDVTCAVRSDFTWRVPFLMGRQEYHCPVCFGKTYVSIGMDDFDTWGESTYKTEAVDRLRMIAMKFSQTPNMPLPDQHQNLEDLLNSLG